MTGNKIVWKRVVPKSCGAIYYRGYTGQWVSFSIHPNISGAGYYLECGLPGVEEYPARSPSINALMESAQDIFNGWFKKLMETKE